MKTNWNEYKFRPSGLVYIMTNGRKKGELSETCKTYLDEIFVEKETGRKKIIQNKYMTKGTFREDESIEFFCEVCNVDFAFKNNKTYENDYVRGTPDLIFKDEIIDIKTNWDYFTYRKADANQYYWQIQAYLWLTGKKKGKIAFCLLNNSDEDIASEQYRASFNNPYKQDTIEYFAYEEETNEQIEKNMKFDDLSKEKKVKIIEFDYSEKDIELLKEKILVCREYLKTLEI
ncbi:hypothetical protein EOM09_05065 [bacterium]|nr:hypothetical protein [bacterium]